MKKILIYLIVLGAFVGMTSCEDTFLQTPNITGSTNIDLVYSDSVNAIQIVMQNYIQGLRVGAMITTGNHGILSNYSDELLRGYSFESYYNIADVGYNPNNTGSLPDSYSNHFNQIRACYLVKENIDRVPNMTQTTKNNIKGEMLGIIAFQYTNMFMRLGGAPIITGSLTVSDNLAIPRASLDSTLNFIVTTSDQAIALLPDNWSVNYKGRLTKSAVMAIKARALAYAARPLFNSATPYLSLGSNNRLICFGSTASPSRWQAAITANLAVITNATANGYNLINTGGGVGVPNPNAFADYATATSTPNNPEVLLPWNNENGTQNGNCVGFWYNYSAYWTYARYDHQLSCVPFSIFKNYYNADGTDASWPQVGDAAPRPATDYVTRCAALEPRFHADQIGPGFDATKTNNPGDAKWNIQGWGYNLGNYCLNSPVNGVPTPSIFPNGTMGYGCSSPTKFYYKAGSRVWFNFPIFRLAENYLNLAEAYNEIGNSSSALQYLNVIHNRAGLPTITETDQTKLRTIIQREWTIEYFMENQRYFLVKHWKLPNISTEILGGQVKEFQFYVTKTDNLPTSLINYWAAVTYTKYWNPAMFLEPIPQYEVNKGCVVQNPGY
jgi:hypothetical protein